MLRDTIEALRIGQSHTIVELLYFHSN